MKTITKAYLALVAVCLTWGTTYLFMRIGVETFPAFLFSGIRQVSAGLLLFICFRFLKIKFSPTLDDVKKQLLPGILLIALGNGIIGWAERYIPSGLAALIVSVIPVYVAIINLLVFKRKKEMNVYIISGLLLGFFGVLLIFKDNLTDLAEPQYLFGVLSAFGASLCWAAGTVYIKNTVSTNSTFANAALQFTIGGIVLCIASLFFDDFSQLHTITSASIGSLVYLTLMGSIFGYICYLYALEHLPIGIVSIYAYINPFIAIALGYLVLNENITWITALAFSTTIGGVILINRGYRKTLTIVGYKPEYAIYFERFNKAWIEEHYTLEAIDTYVLGNPEEAILKPGGKILFAKHKKKIVGAVALKPMTPHIYELTKMAVDKESRGLGAGKLLCEAIIEEARQLGAHKVILYSQRRLETALAVYAKMGFVHVPVEPGTYSRADVKMELELSPASV